MTDSLSVVVQASVTVFGVDASIDLTLAGAPFSIRLAPEEPFALGPLWGRISDALDEVIGFGLPDLGAWASIGGSSLTVAPSLWIGPSGADATKTSAYLALDLNNPLTIGGSIPLGGGVTVSIEPTFSIWSLYIGYDAAAGGLDLRARVTTPTVQQDGTAGPPKSQIVTYPFPVPAQGGGGLKVNYLGLGQRVGPTVQVSANDPMTAIFDQLESELKGNDPRSVLTTLAEQFYQPDRDWFIAADLELKGFRIRVLFNDPTMYGLEITVAADAISPFAGLLFEILYQKLSPNLGLYYGALTLPTLMRRIPLNGFVLILPGFQIWIYTNGDFRINVGWPLGDNSIGISFDILVGRAGFYFAKLRSTDNPGAQPSIDYDPILAFGIGVSLSAGYAYNAGIFSASIALNLSATFQGLLAWKAGNPITAPPDHYWFAATGSLSVLIQGSVDFAVIRASVTISFTANVGIAFETGYATLIQVSADVSVRVSVKVVFFTVHLSFSTSVSTHFTIGDGPPASINGPLAPGLAIVGGFGALSHTQALALGMTETLVARRMPARSGIAAAAPPPPPLARAPLPGTPLRGPMPAVAAAPAIFAASPAAPIELSFVLQPTVTYPPGQFALIASLVTDCPGPGGSPASSGETSFERLIQAMILWLLDYAPGGKYSDRFATLVALLGNGPQAPFGDWASFEGRLRTFLAEACSFTIGGIASDAADSGQAAAMLPMFDVLRLTAPDGSIIDFDGHTPAPSDYPEALQCYFDRLGGLSAAPPSARMPQAGGSPAGRGIATYLFLDYFLMQARNAATALLQAAQTYEKQHQAAFLTAVDEPAAGTTNGLRLAGLVSDYVDRITGDEELAALLAGFDYASAAGIGSRFLLGGMQLPVPADVPPNPTPDNMADVPTAPLFTLTGQQCAVAAGNVASATLSLNPTTILPSLTIDFAGSPGDAATTTFTLPSAVPPMPAPAWCASPASPQEGELEVAWLAPVTPQPMYMALKNQIGWDTPAGPALLLPLPEVVQTLVVERQGLGLAISADPPPSGNATPPPSPSPPVGATAALQIRLSLAQVPAPNTNSVTPVDAPRMASPSGKTQARQYLPHVYQLGGTDEATRDLIHAALAGDLSTARLSLLYPASASGSPARSGSPGSASTVLRSDSLSADVLLAKTNLSTLNLVPETGRVFAAQAELTAPTQTELAPLSDVPGFLRLIWELSVVNAPGYFLFYLTEDGGDLPAALFASAGANGGQTAELDIVVEWGTPTIPIALPACANAVVVEGPGSGDALYAAVFDAATGAAVQSYAPSYPPGMLAFSMLWDRPGDDDAVPVETLYHMLQYAIAAGGAYEGSVWSLPIGPTRNALPTTLLRAGAEELSHYVQSVPAAGFLARASGTPNRYGIIDQPISVDLRIVDIYGNALPTAYAISTTPFYQDPLIAIGEWPGLAVSYRVTSGTAGTAQVAIALAFDPEAIVPPNGSPGSGIAPNRARDAWQAALARYALILDQITDPNLSIRFASSLVDGSIGDGQQAATLILTAQAIATAIAAGLNGSTSPDEPLVTPVAQTITFTIPFSAVRALAELIVPLQVSIRLSRPAGLVDPEARTVLPAALAVDYDVPLDLTGAGMSPGAAGNIMAFAEPFEQAFQDFDGAGGCLKIAQRAGVSIGVPAASAPSLWFVRWSTTDGVAVALSDDLVFFGLAPLSTKPITRTFGQTTFSGVDLDAWARDFLTAYDAFLTPELALAIGVIDLREGTALFDQLARTKQRLASTIKLGLTPLFVDQAAEGDIAAARDRYEQAMLTALASAFTVTTIIQIPASIALARSSPAGSPMVAPRLFGNIGAPDASPVTGAPSPYSLSGGNLDLFPGRGWMTTLLTVAQAERQAELILPLEYQVSYLQHDFEPDEAYLGYVPSSWLKFAIPDAAPLRMTISTAATLPVPLVFQPTAPTLSLQSATAAPLPSPAGEESAEAEIAAAMRWLYGTEMALSLASQDALYVDITYNAPTTVTRLGATELGDPLLGLFDALAAFRIWHTANVGAFGDIPAAAFPPAGSAPIASPGSAGALISTFHDLAADIAAAWEALHAAPPKLLTALPSLMIDHFRISAAAPSASGQIVTVGGRTDAGGQPGVWPTIVSANGQIWTPGGPIAIASPDDWFEATHTFTGPDPLGALTLQFGPLDILDRQSATTTTWIVRNASIGGRQATDPFIYNTQRVSFASPLIPLIRRADLPPVRPAASLADTLTQIMTPIEQFGAQFAPVVRLSASYGYALKPTVGAGGALMIETAVTLLKDVPVTSPGAIGEAAARVIADRFAAIAPSTLKGRLTLAITIFGTQGETTLPLVQFDRIVIPTGGLDRDWWGGGSP